MAHGSREHIQKLIELFCKMDEKQMEYVYKNTYKFPGVENAYQVAKMLKNIKKGKR